MPAYEEISRLVPQAYERLERKRRAVGFASKTSIFLSLGDGTALQVSLNGGGYGCVSEEVVKHQDGFVFFQTDPRLLLWLLKGPGHAQWGNTEIGSHIQYLRRPNIYERGLYYVLASFHA